jgi:sterol desaturase/sphingolipid hydroxylase (fatty acid hydroxylase superfamily)
MVTIVTFLLAGLLTYAVLVVRENRKFSGSGFISYCFPWVHLKSSSTIVDIVLYIASKFTQRFISLFSITLTVALATVAARVIDHYCDFQSKLHPDPLAIGLLSLAMFVFADFGSFLSHYMQHKIPFLWQFHKVHHSALFLTPLTTARFHPIGNLMDGFLSGFFLAIPVAVAAAFYSLTFVKLLAMSAGVDFVFSVMLLSVLQHSHFSISFGIMDRIFISPRMHQVHHSIKHEHWDKNMASRLSIWDWLFGTAFILPKDEVLSFGLGTVEDHRGDWASVWWCYVGPLVNGYNIIRSSKIFPHTDGMNAADSAAE